MDWLNRINWGADGLVTVVVQERGSNDVLMVAHMNREALERTAELGQAVYWSRSRSRLWHKGEESGHFQQVHEIRLDCDHDVVLLQVTQLGGACQRLAVHVSDHQHVAAAALLRDHGHQAVGAPVDPVQPIHAASLRPDQTS
jgi:phosphoribosyl-AMP cyclohydrolase